MKRSLVAILMAAVTTLSLLASGTVANAEQPDGTVPSSSAPQENQPTSVPSVTDVAWDSATGTPLPAWECPFGDICFWNGRNGTGRRCNWDENDRDWARQPIVCSWALTHFVQSVRNNSGYRIEYFRYANYRDRIGSTRPFTLGNLAGTYYLRSHRGFPS
jgi:hypothetical protein